MSLEASRIWRLRLGLEFAARQRDLTGDQLAKLIGAHHRELPAASPCPNSHQCSGSLRTNFRATEWSRMACGRPRVPMDCCAVAGTQVQSCKSMVLVYATDASGGTRGFYGVTRRRCDPVDVAAAGQCAERWKFLSGGFIRARRSIQLKCEQRACQALRLGIDEAHENSRVDLHPSLVESVQADFQLLLFGRGVFDNVPPFSTCLPGIFCVWRKPVEISWGGQSVCHGVASRSESLVKGSCSCWTVWPWCWEPQKAVAVFLLSTTLVAKSV